jgi:tetratricopeptide (TPR) repeat protein
VDPSATSEESIEVAQEAIRVFEALGDQLGLARAWRALGMEQRRCGRLGESERACERALEHATRAGDRREESRSADQLCTALLYGPAEATSALARCMSMLERSEGNPLLEANVLASIAGLYGMLAEFDEARTAARRAERIYLELGLRLAFAGLTQVAGPIELLGGDPFAAEEILRRGYDILHEIGASGESDALLAEALYSQGRYEEAALVASSGSERTSKSDVAPRVLIYGVDAKLAARLGKGGEELARSGVALAAKTDALNLHADALLNLAETLRLLGQAEESQAAVDEAAGLYVRKGNVAALARLQAMTV